MVAVSKCFINLLVAVLVIVLGIVVDKALHVLNKAGIAASEPWGSFAIFLLAIIAIALVSACLRRRGEVDESPDI